MSLFTPVLADYEAVSDEMARDAKAAFEQLTASEGLTSEWRMLEGMLIHKYFLNISPNIEDS